MPDNRVRIFVSSPADVEHERATVKAVVERLAQEYIPYFTLQTVLWEEEALTADRTFQAGLTHPSDCDIVLVILWTRLGSPLPQQPYRGMTGTEWEFLSAVEASSRDGRPEVLVYKKTAAKLVDITDAAAAQEAMEDRRRLETFFREHFFNPDNTFRRAFRTFDNDAAFRELVEVQLRKLLNRRISAERRAAAGPAHWQGSPFRPDRPFEVADERVFTGREREIRELLGRLEARRADEPGFLLLSGPGAAGRTSLLRAGLAARLARPFLFERIAGVRCVLTDPLADAPTPLGALAAGLCRTEALGDPLSRFGLSVAQFERLLAGEPELAARQIESALHQLTPASADPDASIRLALILDPLEDLLEANEPDTLQPFARALRALAEIPAIWVVASLRSDALPRLAALDRLLELVTPARWIELEPLPTARIRQVVEIPLRIAGIEPESGPEPEPEPERERETEAAPEQRAVPGRGSRRRSVGEARGPGLVEQIEAEASRLRLWAPPVQGLLDRFYREALGQAAPDADPSLPIPISTPSPTRTPALGDALAGQVLQRAQRLWSGLDDRQRAALPRLCRALIGLDADGLRPVIRQGDLRALRADADCAALLRAMIRAHLVIAEGVPDPTRLVPCEQPDERLLGILQGAWRQWWRDWTAHWRPPQERPAAAQDPSAQPGARPERTLAAAADGPAEAPAVDLAAYHPVASFSHPALIRHWPPVRDWLRDADNRRLLQVRGQLTRQALLWKRTDCNREYLYGELSHAAARRFADPFAGELEPVEQEFLQRSAAQIGFVRRRNRLVRAFGVMLLALLVGATGAAGLAWQASRDARINLHRGQLKEADLHITRGNTPQAVIQAIAAGEDLPHQAVQTLSLAFSRNRLLAMARSGDADPGDPHRPAFDADGTLLATITPQQGAQLWRLTDGRYVPDQALHGDGLGLHSLVIATDGTVFGIGPAGIWALPAEAEAPPRYPCGSPPGTALRLDAARRYLALGSADGAVCVVDLQQPGRVLLQRTFDEGEIRGLSFSPQGDRLLTASALGRTHIIDLRSGDILHSLPADGPLGRPFNSAVFDAAGERIAIAAVDERVRLYHGDGRPLDELAESDIGGEPFKIHRTAVREVAFAPNGAFLVAADDQGQVVRWSLDGSRQAVVLGNHGLSITSLAMGPAPVGPSEETLVLTGSLDQTARLWGLETGKPLAVLGHDGALSAAAFSRDGSRVQTFSRQDGSARLWSVRPGSRLAFELPHPDHVWDLSLAIAPPELAHSGTGADPGEGPGEDPGVANGMQAETPPGTTLPLLLATAGYDGGVRVWRYHRATPGALQTPTASSPRPSKAQANTQTQPPPEPLLNLQAHADRVRQVRFSGSARRLASAAYDGTAQVHDLISGSTCVLPVTPDNDAGRVYNALFGPDERWLLTTSDASAEPVRLFSIARCAPIDAGPALTHGNVGVTAAAIRALDASTLIATGDEDGTLRLLSHDPAAGDAASGWSRRCALDLGIGPVGSLTLSGDGRLLAAAGSDSRAALVHIDPQTVDCRLGAYLEGHTGRVYSVDIAPDGRRILTGSLDKTARLWGRDGTPRAVLRGHEDRIYRADFSPDGDWMLTASRDGSLRLWRAPGPGGHAGAQSDFRDGSESGDIEQISTFLPLRADLGGVASAAFSPDGHYIAGAYWENAALLWRIWTEEQTVPRTRIERWGRERARLALIDEAYRFRAANLASP
ncbi:AAA family ATPase [Thiohalocapsa marina]|uniref:AAA family ATPase n=1 Tax=Thiohalocapsa marina TaxID=424902 RepID=A0A5M8FP28_9GAMM|nr:AAA family ATPase [Thiohalocapsa marina]KAA6186648.1 AAA family ATPase [Thiohalocapsa marina]